MLRHRPQDPDGFPKAVTVSALEQQGLKDAWEEMQRLTDWRKEHGHFDSRRREQIRYWFEEEVRQALLAQLQQSDAKEQMTALGDKVASGNISASKAASDMLKVLKN